MPTTFWKDHSDGVGPSPDVDALREKYISDGEKVARRLAVDDRVRAVWLSGPFVPPRIHPASDLHMGVLAIERRHVSYHHILSPFSEVGRRLEIAFFPDHYFRSIIDEGITSWGDVFDLHKLSDMRILHDTGGRLRDTEQRIVDVKPAPLFIGGQIASLKTDLAHLHDALVKGENREAVLAGRTVVMSALRILVLLVCRTSFSKTAHLYSEASVQLHDSISGVVDRALAVDGLNEQAACRLLDHINGSIRAILQGRVNCSDGSN